MLLQCRFVPFLICNSKRTGRGRVCLISCSIFPPKTHISALTLRGANIYSFPLPRQWLTWQLPKIAPPQYPSLNLIEMLTIGGGGSGGTTLVIFPAISVFILPAAAEAEAASRVADCAVRGRGCPSVRLPQN